MSYVLISWPTHQGFESQESNQPPSYSLCLGLAGHLLTLADRLMSLQIRPKTIAITQKNFSGHWQDYPCPVSVCPGPSPALDSRLIAFHLLIYISRCLDEWPSSCLTNKPGPGSQSWSSFPARSLLNESQLVNQVCPPFLRFGSFFGSKK